MKTNILILILVLVVTLSACAEASTPRSTVKHVFDHMKTGEVEEAMKVLSRPEDAQPIIESLSEPIQAVASKKIFQHAEIEIEDGMIFKEGNVEKAVVNVHMTSLDDESVSELWHHLEHGLQELPSDLSREEMIKALDKVADELDWDNLSTYHQLLRYHLIKDEGDGGKWKILFEETEVLDQSVEE